MALTLAQWAASLPDASGTYEIADTVDNLLDDSVFTVPVVGPALKSLLDTLLGDGQTTITALVDGASGLSDLTPTDISGLADLGTTLIDPGADSSVPLSTLQQLADAGMGIVDTVLTTVEATPAELENLSPDAINSLAQAGADVLDTAGDAVDLTLDQVDALTGSNLTLGSDVGTLVGSAADIAGLTLTDIASLLTAGIKTIDVTDDALYITVDQALAFAAAGTKFDPSDVVTIYDTPASLQALTTTQIGQIADIGADSIDSNTNLLSLSLAQLDALATNGIALTNDDTVTALDTAANLETLSPDDIATLAADGVDAINSSDDILSISLAQFNALNTNGVALADADTVTLADTGARLEALTTGEIANLAAKGVDEIDATDGALSLTAAQAVAAVDAGLTFAADDVVTVTDTGANIADISSSEIALLKAAGVDALDVTGATTLTAAQAAAFAAAGLDLADGGSVTLSDTGANIAAMSPSTISNLAAIGVDTVDATDNTVSLDADSAKAFAHSGVTFAPDDDVTLADTGAHIAGLSADDIEALKPAGIDRIDVTDNAATIDADQAAAVVDAGLTFADNDDITVAQNGAALAGLTASQIAAMGAAGIDHVDATDNTLRISFAQLQAFSDAGITLAAGDTVVLADTGANLAALTLAQIADLVGRGVDSIDIADDTVSASFNQIQAFSTSGLAFANGDVVQLGDTGAHIAALTADQIAALKAMGVGGANASDNAVSMSVDQARAFATAALDFAVDDVVSVADTAQAIGGLSVADLAALASTGVDELDSTSNTDTVDIARNRAMATAGLKFAADDVATLADTASNIQKLSTGDIAGLAATGIDAIDATNDRAMVDVAQEEALADAGIGFADRDKTRLVDSGLHIKAMTKADIAGLKATGIDLVDATDNRVAINAAQERAFDKAGTDFAAGDLVRLVDTGGRVAKMSAGALQGLHAVGVDGIDLSNNAITITVAKYKLLGPVDFAANDRVTVKGHGHADTVVADGSDVTIMGMKGADRLTGGADHDVLAGGRGHDILKGGSGSDEFLFDMKLSNRDSDVIKSFNVHHDDIALDHSIFKAIGNNLDKGEFFMGTKAHDRNDHIIYDKAHGALYYDDDGKGHHAAVQIATVTHGLDLTASDFLIV